MLTINETIVIPNMLMTIMNYYLGVINHCKMYVFNVNISTIQNEYRLWWFSICGCCFSILMLYQLTVAIWRHIFEFVNPGSNNGLSCIRRQAKIWMLTFVNWALRNNPLKFKLLHWRKCICKFRLQNVSTTFTESHCGWIVISVDAATFPLCGS